MDTGRRWPIVARVALTCLLIVAVYYVVPVEGGLGGIQLVIRGVAALGGGAAITWLIVRQVSYQIARPYDAPLLGLLTAVVGGVVFFAYADYAVAVSGQGQFVGLATKTDALYFTLATLTTVGYGDIHPVGQLARGVVVVQLLFNVVVVATAASVLARQLGARIRRSRDATDGG